jgi:putative aldouronate transport system substrate-binding protein
MNQYDVYAYGEDGYFMELSGLIEQYGDNYKVAYERLDDETKRRLDGMMVNPSNDAIYAMPSVAVEAMDNLQSIMFINQDWLNKVGMQAPTNVEELYNVLKAFKTQDPNGNGQADEIGMLGSSDIANYIINAFVYYDASRSFNVADGKVWNPSASEEYRQALTYIRKLVEEGLLSDLSFTTTSTSDIQQLITPADNVAKVGIWSGHPALYTSANTEILNQYTALKYLQAETEKGGYNVVDPVAIYLASYITKDCDNVARAMKLLDFFYNDETVKRMRNGEYGVDWTDGEGFDMCGVPNTTQVLNPQAFFEGNATWCKCIHAIYTNENYLFISDEEGEGRAAQVNRLSRESTEILQSSKEADVLAPKDTVQGLRYTAEENAEREQYISLYTEYVKESRDLFVTGNKDITNDAVWKDYLETLKSTGEETVMKIYQTSWDRLYGDK